MNQNRYNLPSLFPWMLALSEDAQDVCARELIQAARVSISSKDEKVLNEAFRSWRETALAIDAGLKNQSVDWLINPETVERP